MKENNQFLFSSTIQRKLTDKINENANNLKALVGSNQNIRLLAAKEWKKFIAETISSTFEEHGLNVEMQYRGGKFEFNLDNATKDRLNDVLKKAETGSLAAEDIKVVTSSKLFIDSAEDLKTFKMNLDKELEDANKKIDSLFQNVIPPPAKMSNIFLNIIGEMLESLGKLLMLIGPGLAIIAGLFTVLHDNPFVPPQAILGFDHEVLIGLAAIPIGFGVALIGSQLLENDKSYLKGNLSNHADNEYKKLKQGFEVISTDLIVAANELFTKAHDKALPKVEGITGVERKFTDKIKEETRGSKGKSGNALE